MLSLSLIVDLVTGGLCVTGFLLFIYGPRSTWWSRTWKIVLLVSFGLAGSIEGGFQFLILKSAPRVSGSGQITLIEKVREDYYPRGVLRTYYELTINCKGSTVGPLMGPFESEDNGISQLGFDDSVEFTYIPWKNNLEKIEVIGGPHRGLLWISPHLRIDNTDWFYLIAGIGFLSAAVVVSVTGQISKPNNA